MGLELQGKIKQYLLGRATEAEREEVESAILTDDQAFEELEAIESELVDDYVSGRLPLAERAAFERNFLRDGERQLDLRFSRALHRYAGSNASIPTAIAPQATTWWQQTWLPRAVAAFALVLVVLAAAWYVLSRRNEPTSFVALTLSLTASNRGEGNIATSVKLPLNADALKLNLQLPDVRAGTYRVRLVSSAGEQELKISESNAQSITVIITADRVMRGAYALQLYKVNSDGSEERIPGSYFFTVE